MNPFDYSKAFISFWTAQSEALVKVQQQAATALAEGMRAVASGKIPKPPDMPTELSDGVADLARAGESMVELWSAAVAMCGKLATTIPTDPAADTPVDAAFRKMVDPRSWMAVSGELDDVLGRMAEGPRFADLWEVERRYARVLQGWIGVRRRALEHNAVVLQAWLQAGRRFMAQVSRRSGADAQVLDAKAALALWTDTANEQLLEAQRSEPFLQTQAAMIRASTELRMAQQELVEHFGQQYGFPTRTELDDVHRTVTELRRELRTMRRELRPPATIAPVPAQQPTLRITQR
jgi:polyhydroxyalkanoate synthase subunit PhaE